MMLALLAGCAAGVGLWFVWSGLRPAPQSLGAALARLEGTAAVQQTPADAGTEPDRDARLGRWILGNLPPLARAVEAMRADLRITGMTPEEHAARVGTYVMMALLAGPWIVLVSTLTGWRLPLVLPATVSGLGLLWGVLAPFARVRGAAAARREVFSYALSAWCDVVVMSLAAGRGVEQAMETGATAGQGWAFAELRGALGAGYMRGDPPWQALGALGRELKIKEMEELASTISMAGEEGAAVRETLAAKSRTIRDRRTATAEQEAASATEKMGLPAVLMVFGFVIFLAFPIVVGLLQGGL